MKLIDVTLRDGGHQHGFNWPLELVRDYLAEVESFPEINFVELGYWKQEDKYDGDFYRINEELLNRVATFTQKQISIMVDYHYCSHDVTTFPKASDFKSVGLIRVCLRKEDIREGCAFVKELKRYTGLRVSINFFNVTNYMDEDLEFACGSAKHTGADFMYFADTHGALDLDSRMSTFQNFTSVIKEIGMTPGLHLHDHSGKAYFNFRNLNQAGFDITDVSLGGLGKGMGNLKLEQVLDLRGRDRILDFLILHQDYFSMPRGPFGILTARDSITDHYAVEAERMGMLPSDLSDRLSRVKGVLKDNYDKRVLTSE